MPDVLPAQFQSNYTPIAAAGTEAQIEHLARLLATQLTAAGLGPGIEEVSKIARVNKLDYQKLPICLLDS